MIGGAGLVGSNLRRAFRGRPVAATYHRTDAPGAIRLDVTERPSVERLLRDLRPDVIALAAAEAYVERCEREPEATRKVNVEAARTVAGLARELGAMLVVFSSEYVFDGARGPYAEDDPVAPINEYGRQKVELEAIARDVPRHLVCRTSAAFGWEALGRNFVCQAIRSLRRGETFDVADDQVVTPTYAPELAAAVAELVRRGVARTYHVVGPRVLARAAFARLVASTFGLPERLIRARPTAELGLSAPRPRDSGLADERLRAELGRSLSRPEEALVAMRDEEGAQRTTMSQL